MSDEKAWQKFGASTLPSIKRLYELNEQLTGLRNELCELRRAIIEARRQGDYGRSPQLQTMLDARNDLAEAELAATERHVERLEILKRHHASMSELEQRATKAVADGRASKLDQLRAGAARVEAEIRLHQRQHPSTRPEQFDLMASRVDAARDTFLRIYELFELQAIGGESEKCCLAALNLAERRAELELARSEYREALRYQRIAADVGVRAIKVAQAAYDLGTMSLDAALAAQSDASRIQMKLLKWERRYGEGPLSRDMEDRRGLKPRSTDADQPQPAPSPEPVIPLPPTPPRPPEPRTAPGPTPQPLVPPGT